MEAKLIPALLLSIGIAACGGGGGSSEPEIPPPPPAPAKSAKFAIISDPHVYDTAALGVNADFEAYLLQDRKMVKESIEILDAVIGDFKGSALDFVLIPGDLTKDGEKINHQVLAKKLADIEAQGKKVFVIPGNHDILNPDAKSYLGITSKTPSVSPTEFADIYKEYGFGEAIYKDPNGTLSYIAEPVTGVWLFAIDSCLYATDSTRPITGGRIKPETQTWIIEKLKEAKQLGKQVIGMMHHGIVEHYNGQVQFFPEYVIKDHASIGKNLADNGLNVVFTGHYHANDVSKKDFGSSVLYDVETGSTVTAPSPYRLVDYDIAGKKFDIRTRTVQSIASRPADFASYAKTYLVDGLRILATGMLQGAFKLNATEAAQYAPLFADAFTAHYAGDEKPTVETQQTIGGLLAKKESDPRLYGMGMVLGSLWTDLAPPDNTLTIQLENSKN